MNVDDEGEDSTAPVQEEAILATAEKYQMELSMNSIAGISSAKTMKLRGSVTDKSSNCAD